MLGKRKDSGLFGLPGGWLETGEDWEDAAKRECQEEIGLDIEKESFKHIYTLNCKYVDKKYHSISCIMFSEVIRKDKENIMNKEPHKCAGWIWITFDQIRSHENKLFYPLRDFLAKFPNLKDVKQLKEMIKE